jgi:hypothetical protein
VAQPDGGTRLVDLLAAGATATHETLVNIRRPSAHGSKSLVDLGW